MGDLEFRVLGPVEVVRDGAPVALGRGMLIDLLAALLVSANRVILADDLVDMVWHTRSPAHPRAALHNGIARLRRVIDGDQIETLAQGYRFHADAEHLDVLRFEELIAEAEQAASAPDAERALTQALALWRGTPLGNVDSPVLLTTAAQQLTHRYLDTCGHWAELCLEMGRHDAVTARLASVVESHPFREQLVGQLMVAMYQTGRRAEALACYESVRRVLADELGVDPGPGIQDLHMRILRDDPSLSAGGRGDAEYFGSPSAVPRQLPPDVPDFCGRDGEVRSLTDALTGTGAMPGETRIAVISGPGGVGKTAMAVHAAHRLAETFGDGQLFADLNGVAGSPAQPDEVLASFLRALGVAGSAIPRSLSDRMTMYRSLAAERRLLIVLDNAADESQVRQLMPASAGCAVIVTSRVRMTGLAGARAVHLCTLDNSQALDLLSRIIGPDRARAESADVTTLTGLCGGLPLALRIAGARLAARPHWPVAKLAGRLADARQGLNELVHGDLDVRASFALSYESLDEAAKTMLRRVSLLDAPDFPAWAGAALLDVDPGDAEDICERLVDAQLLGAQSRPEIRYRLHDLVRAFARERALSEETDDVRTEALARAFGGWMALAEGAHRRVYGGDFTILHGEAPRWTGAGQAVLRAVDDDPIGWLDGERHAISAVIGQSADLGMDELSWDLAWTAVTLYESRTYYDDRLATQQHALAAVVRAGNRRGEAAMLAANASTLLQLGRIDEARAPTRECLRLFGELGDARGRAIGLYRLGTFHNRSGNREAAVNVCQELIAAARLTDDPMLEALGFRELALAHLDFEDYEAAAECATRSRHILEETGTGPTMMNSLPLHVLGEVHLRRGELDAAIDTFRRILQSVQASNDLPGQAHVLLSLGEALSRAGRREEGARDLRRALGAARQSRQRAVEARLLFVLATLNPERSPASDSRELLTQSLAIFTDLALPRWQERVSSALLALDEALTEKF